MFGKVTGSISEPVGCEGATSEIIVGRISDGGIIEIFVNGQGLGLSHPYGDGVVNILLSMGIEMIPLDANGNVLTIESLAINDLAERAHFINHTNQYKQIQIVLGDASQVKNNYTPENQSFNYDLVTQITTFCLAPANSILCTPDYIEFKSKATDIDSSQTYALTVEVLDANGDTIYPKTTSAVEGNMADSARDLSYVLYQILKNEQTSDGADLLVTSSGTLNPEGAYFQAVNGHIQGGTSQPSHPVQLNIYRSENLMGANVDLFSFLETVDGEIFEDVIEVRSCGAQQFNGI
ncbi:hypothetical protein [Acinetobacter tandoii]